MAHGRFCRGGRVAPLALGLGVLLGLELSSAVGADLAGALVLSNAAIVSDRVYGEGMAGALPAKVKALVHGDVELFGSQFGVLVAALEMLKDLFDVREIFLVCGKH